MHLDVPDLLRLLPDIHLILRRQDNLRHAAAFSRQHFLLNSTDRQNLSRSVSGLMPGLASAEFMHVSHPVTGVRIFLSVPDAAIVGPSTVHIPVTVAFPEPSKVHPGKAKMIVLSSLLATCCPADIDIFGVPVIVHGTVEGAPPEARYSVELNKS